MAFSVMEWACWLSVQRDVDESCAPCDGHVGELLEKGAIIFAGLAATRQEFS